MPKIYGYYRVSTSQQNPALQIESLKKAGCDKIVGDIGVSGTKASRPAFDKMLKLIGEGDKVIVWRLDRMGRSLRHLIEVNQYFCEHGATFESLTEKIDTSTPIGEFIFHIFAAVAQYEIDMNRERTLAGMEIAASHGRHPGRPRSMSPDQVQSARQLMRRQSHSVRQIADNYGVSAETLRRRLTA